MLEKDTPLYFKSWRKTMSPGHIIVTDCKCITKKSMQPGKDQEHLLVMNGLCVIRNSDMTAVPLDFGYFSFEGKNAWRIFVLT